MSSEIPKCFYRVSVKALILDETKKKFLIVQEDNGRWDFPGGGLDWGELPRDGLEREIKEEMGLKVLSVAKNPSYFLTCKADTGVFYSNVFYETVVDNLNFSPSGECVAIKFVSTEEAKQMDTFPNVRIFAYMFDPK